MPVFHPLICLLGFIVYTFISCTLALSLWITAVSLMVSLYAMRSIGSTSRAITQAPDFSLPIPTVEQLPSWLQIQRWPGKILRTIPQRQAPNRVTFVLGSLTLVAVMVGGIAWLMQAAVA